MRTQRRQDPEWRPCRKSAVFAQWQWKNSLTERSGRWLECSTWLTPNVDPSEPVPRTLKVNVLLTTESLFWLKPPHVVNLPV